MVQESDEIVVSGDRSLLLQNWTAQLIHYATLFHHKRLKMFENIVRKLIIRFNAAFSVSIMDSFASASTMKGIRISIKIRKGIILRS